MWKALNSAAWVGWIALGVRLLVMLAAGGRVVGASTWALTVALEAVCCLEVVRMLTGSLQGNVFLGVSLHYIRSFVVFVILPSLEGHPAVLLVLVAWAATEICRYPYYIFGGAAASKLRYATPILTFPLGAGGEAWACYCALPQLAGIARAAAALQIFVNLLGGLATYPGMVKKALKALKGEKEGGRGGKKGEEASVILFPLDAKGGRSTTPAGRSLIAAALRAGGGDAAARAAERCEREANWRFGYDKHLLRLVELGCASPEVALRQARAGLAWAHEHFQVCAAPGAEPRPVAALVSGAAAGPAGGKPLATLRAEGPAAPAGGAAPGLRVPFNGAYARGSTSPPGPDAVLQGQRLKAQLNAWAAGGVIEADAALRAAAAEDYLAGGGTLKGCHFVVIGASSAMGPTRHLLRHGAHVIGVSRGGGSASRTAWRELAALACASPGAVLEAPLAGGGGDRALKGGGDAAGAEDAGADLLRQPAQIREWLLRLVGQIPPGERVVVGNYTYLDGDLHVKLAVAADALVAALQAARPKVGVAFLGTPTDAHVVPAAAAQAAAETFGGCWRAGAPLEALVRLLTLGRRLAPGFRAPVKGAGGAALHVADNFSLAQGPNYAIAKRLQHWRTVVTYAEGGLASSRVAPSTATASVVHNRTFEWAYLGMPFFKPLEVFKEETAAAVMAALLIADVVKCGEGHSTKDPDAPQAAIHNPIELSGTEAVHGGVFRCAYKFGTVGEVCVLVHFLGGPDVCKVLSPGLAVAGLLAAGLACLRIF